MIQRRNSIVCGIDGSAGSARATRVAAELAASLAGRLILVHVVDDLPRSPSYGEPGERELRRRRGESAGRRMLQEAAAGLDAALSVRIGDPVGALEAVCREEGAELLVVGSRGQSGLAGVLLGRICARLASKGVCPVVIVPPDAGERFSAPATSGGAIICGVDGGAESARALSVAEWLGGQMGLETLPVFVMPARSSNAAAPRPAEILTGDPVRELRACATREDARMIVVGSRGHGALRRALLGSVSAALAGAAPVPVLVVPPEARLPATVGDPAQRPASTGPLTRPCTDGSDERIIARGIPLY